MGLFEKHVDIFKKRDKESWQQSMPADDAEYRLPAGRNAILRTTARRPVRAVLVYDRFRAEQTVPVRDGIDRGAKSGVSYIVQPGGSVRDDLVIEACDEYGMVMICNGVRLFHH